MAGCVQRVGAPATNVGANANCPTGKTAPFTRAFLYPAGTPTNNAQKSTALTNANTLPMP